MSQFKKGDEAWWFGGDGVIRSGVVTDIRGEIIDVMTRYGLHACGTDKSLHTSRSACIDAEVAKEVKRHEEAMKRLDALRG